MKNSVKIFKYFTKFYSIEIMSILIKSASIQKYQSEMYPCIFFKYLSINIHITKLLMVCLNLKQFL